MEAVCYPLSIWFHLYKEEEEGLRPGQGRPSSSLIERVLVVPYELSPEAGTGNFTE